MHEYKLQYVTNVIVTDNMYNINNGSRSKQVLLTINQTIQTNLRRLYFISRSNFVAVNLCLFMHVCCLFKIVRRFGFFFPHATTVSPHKTGRLKQSQNLNFRGQDVFPIIFTCRRFLLRFSPFERCEGVDQL